MATPKNAAPPPAMPPLPPTATHEAPVAEAVPLVDVDGVQMEAHPVGTAQYIAELEAENTLALEMQAAVAGRATEGFKAVAEAATTHAVAMAGHLPQDINLIPGTDALNGTAPQ